MANLKQTRLKTHFFYLDVLRALAIFAVLILHLSADPASAYGKLPALSWLSSALYNGLTRFCVPMFVLISGSLLLNPARDASIKELFSKRLPKLLIPLVVWSIIYVLFQNYGNHSFSSFSFVNTLKAFYQGPLVFHFWFLYMMIGIYLIYPVINAFIKGATESQVLYFIAIWFMVNCILGMIETLFETAAGLELYSFTGYIGYFVLGYYLQNHIFTKQQLKLAGFAGTLAFMVSVSGVILLQTCHIKHYAELIESDFTPEIPFALAGIFLFFKSYNFSEKPTWFKGIAAEISRESYGIYIVHVLFMRLLFDKAWLNISFKNYSLLWVIPVQAIAVLILSNALTKLIRMVPFLRLTV
jgi:surface polysaccharide O-acyltransferase-like enzyme